MTDEVLTTDQLIERMMLDELSDAPLVTPVNYAHMRPITAQLVYYRIRSGKLQTHVCNCGRTCIDKDEADTFFRGVYGPVKWPYGKDKDEPA